MSRPNHGGIVRALTGILLASATLSAAPAISAIYNNSSFIPTGYPGYGIAPSSLFVIQGTGLADPGTPVLQDTTHGLPLTLSGASLSVTVSGKTTHPAIYYTSPTQVAAVLPAATPVGTGTITVTYKGATSAPFPVKVVTSALGFSMYAGSVAIATDAVTGALLGYTQSGKPGEIILLWGTGLGADPADSDTTYTPAPHQLNVNLQLYIGEIKADIIYQGASVYPGVAVLGVTIPPSVATGCFVSVSALIDQTPSNVATLPIASDGGVCHDAYSGLDGKQINQAALGTYKTGSLRVLQNNSVVSGNPKSSGQATAALLQVSTSFAPEAPAVGGCLLSPGSGSVSVTGLDSGTVTLTPSGGSAVTMTGFATGEYSALLPVVPGGNYTFRGSGGTQVGGFQAAINMPVPALNWTNQSAAATVNRAAGLPVTWTGGMPKTLVNITGFSAAAEIGVGFSCLVAVEAGQFTVPANILLALPAGSGYVVLINNSPPGNFSATGIDFGTISASINFVENTIYN